MCPLSDNADKQEQHAGSEGRREPIWPGSKLDWSTALVPIQLYLELPFWLMMPEGVFDVTHQGATLKIAVAHGCEEIQRTATHLKNRSSTVFITRQGEAVPQYVQQMIDQSASASSARIHRTTLIIETAALESALRCRTGTPPERAHAIAYLSALAVGHLPVVNALITAYRRAGNDPFALELSESTAPIWFLRLNDRFLRVSVYPYADLEYRADWPTKEGTQEPADLATVDEVTEFLALKSVPGETILLDAWSYFYAGRFSDSIRGLISAIEVLLEARYSEALTQHGVKGEALEAALRANATKFTTRLNHYLQLTKRTIPGPLLSWVPYINGVRLRDELHRTRELRHKIVHEGLIMSSYEHGAMLRAAETMTWLFDWLEDNERSSRNRLKLYNLKGYLKGRVQFGVEYAGGVKVIEHNDGAPSEYSEELLVDNQLWKQHSDALFGNHKNLALFTKMSLACILKDDANIAQAFMGSGLGLVDCEQMEPHPGVNPERFKFAIDDVPTAAFLIELDGELAASDLNGVLVRLLQLRVESGGKRVHGLCVVNHQLHVAPALREVYRQLPDEVTALLGSCDLSLVLATDLARYIRGVRDYGWRLTPIREAMKVGGYIPCTPPGGTYAAKIVKVFPKLGVLGVDVDASPALEQGDQIVVQSPDGFEMLKVESITIEAKEVKSVAKGLAGLKVATDVKKIAEGAIVFRPSPSPVPAAPVQPDAPVQQPVLPPQVPGQPFKPAVADVSLREIQSGGSLAEGARTFPAAEPPPS